MRQRSRRQEQTRAPPCERVLLGVYFCFPSLTLRSSRISHRLGKAEATLVWMAQRRSIVSTPAANSFLLFRVFSGFFNPALSIFFSTLSFFIFLLCWSRMLSITSDAPRKKRKRPKKILYGLPNFFHSPSRCSLRRRFRKKRAQLGTGANVHHPTTPPSSSWYLTDACRGPISTSCRLDGDLRVGGSLE